MHLLYTGQTYRPLLLKVSYVYFMENYFTTTELGELDKYYTVNLQSVHILQ